MNKKYWENYYRDLLPTSFAEFCTKYIPIGSKVIDVGCGNGRDTVFFSNVYDTIGIDYAIKPLWPVAFYKMDVNNLVKTAEVYDVVYSRFFLHSITDKEIIKFVEWSKGLFMAEFRDKTDDPKLYKNHKRNLVDGEWIKQLLINNGFKIIYYKKGRNMAKYRDENPMVVRVIAKKADVSI